MLLILLACTSPRGESPPPASDDTGGESGVTEPGLSPGRPQRSGLTPSAGLNPPRVGVPSAPTPRTYSDPVACDEIIYQPVDGWDDAKPALADPHADTLGATPQPYHEHPQWSADPATTVSFLWRTDGATLASQVRIEEEGGAAERVIDGASFLLAGDEAGSRVHEVRVCGLLPDRNFTWRVGGDGAWSREWVHTTAPEAGETARLRFGVGGDSRDDMTVLRAVFAGMNARGAQFRLFTGDAVASGSDVVEWNEWFDAGEGFLQAAPTVSANGNHENLGQPYLALFAQPGNERTFSFDYANAHFVVLNDSPSYSGEMEEQSAWLREDLAGTTQPWKFVFHHKPGWTASSHSPDDEVRENFVPVEEDGGVALDFAGHNHNYERSVPLRDGLETPPEVGTTYIVTAGAGAPIYPNFGDAPEMVVGIEEHHYVIVDIYGSRLDLFAYDLAGNILDTYSLTR